MKVWKLKGVLPALALVCMFASLAIQVKATELVSTTLTGSGPIWGVQDPLQVTNAIAIVELPQSLYEYIIATNGTDSFDVSNRILILTLGKHTLRVETTCDVGELKFKPVGTGDVDRDGEVDMFDLAGVARALTTDVNATHGTGWDQYNAWADFTGAEGLPDGAIDVYDLYAAGVNYGQWYGK